MLPKRHFSYKDTHRLKVKRWKKKFLYFQIKRAGVALLISDKIDLKQKTVTRDKEGHYIMIKELIHQEDIAVVHNKCICSQPQNTKIY